MSTTDINETIEVGVVFSNGKVVPTWFKWKNDRIEIKEIKKTWSTIPDGVNMLHFAVTSPVGFYELSFNQKTLATTFYVA